MAFEVDDEQPYIVLINDEGQYSLWPEAKAVPAGWRAESFRGQRLACVEYVDAHWQDMRPRSLAEAAER